MWSSFRTINNRMIRCVFSFIFAIVALTVSGDPPPIKTDIIKNIIICKNEHNATRGDYDAIRKSNVPETLEGKCFMACIFEKSHITRGGKYSTDSFVKGVVELYKDESQKRRKAIEMVNDCGTRLADEWTSGADKCAYSAKVMECLASYAPRVPVIKDFLEYQQIAAA
ncbi:hypothetical protein L798_14856 [Zootermopsis nevadensis]|uniref:Uncharacterized protein n=2 Tax=Zootermopsis nevadensis TaxID=136037 RepID=A0A067QRL5_ZOONE|nr:hypothetical protein L798_14856 [Zootermopsis nevadensis]